MSFTIPAVTTVSEYWDTGEGREYEGCSFRLPAGYVSPRTRWVGDVSAGLWLQLGARAMPRSTGLLAACDWAFKKVRSKKYVCEASVALAWSVNGIVFTEAPCRVSYGTYTFRCRNRHARGCTASSMGRQCLHVEFNKHGCCMCVNKPKRLELVFLPILISYSFSHKCPLCS